MPDDTGIYSGGLFTIAATHKNDWPNDRRRVSSVLINAPGDATFNNTRWICFDKTGAGNPSANARAIDGLWSFRGPDGNQVIADPDGTEPSPARINYGDKVTVYREDWQISIGDDGTPTKQMTQEYLSCRINSPVGSGFRIGVVSSAASWEQWTIVDPAGSASGPLSFGSEFMLRFESNPPVYLSQTTDGSYDIVTATTSKENTRWVVGPGATLDPKPVRYEDMVVFASNGARMFASDDSVSGVIFDSTSPLSDLSRWIVTSDGLSKEPLMVKFGDDIGLGINAYKDDPLNPSSTYLQYPGDIAPEWKIIDPDHPASVAQVRFGDRVALHGRRGNGNYLASDGTTSATLGPRTTFTLGDAFNELSTQVAMPGLPAAPDGLDNSAMLLSVGDSLQKTIVVKAVGLVPEVGDTVSGLVGFLWTEDGPDIWGMIEERVKKLVKEAIDQNNIDLFKQKIAALKDQMRSYVGPDLTDSEKATYLGQMDGNVDALGEAAKVLTQPQETLPYLVIAANLHLIILHEGFINYLRYNGGASFSGIADSSAKLKQWIHVYSRLAATFRQQAVDWRTGPTGGFISWSAQWDHETVRTYLTDTYLRNNGIFRIAYSPARYEYVDSDNDKKWYPTDEQNTHCEWYQARMGEAFGSQLDAVALSAPLWRYLDPDVDETPRRTAGILIDGAFGKLGDAEGAGFYEGNRYWNLPFSAADSSLLSFSDFYDAGFNPDRQPSDTINNIGWRAGDLVYVFAVNGQEIGQNGAGTTSTHMVDPRRIVAASGREEWSCHKVLFTNNRGVVFGDGGGGGVSWTSKLPDETHPALVGISGSGDNKCLNQLYLHWQYTRWG